MDLRALFDASDGFRRPAVARGHFDAGVCSREDVMQALRSVAAEPWDRARLRVYVEGGQRADAERRVLENPPRSGETITDWAARVFEGRRFGLVLNSAERYNDALTARLGQWFRGVFDITGFPVGGLEMVFFVGDYGYTPFGVHADRDQATVFHFHLGPGRKQGLVWEPAVFREVTGGTHAFFDPDAIRHAAHSHEFGEGDLYVLPSDNFHIGRTDTLSVDIAVALVRMTTHQLVERLFSRSCEAALARIEKREVAHVKDAALADLPSDLRGAPAPGAGFDYATAFREHLAELRSNAGFNATPSDAPPIDSERLEKGTLRRRSPFPLVLQATGGGRVNLFARGRRLGLVETPGLTSLVERLQSGADVPAPEAIAALAQDYEVDAARALVNRLVELRAVEWREA